MTCQSHPWSWSTTEPLSEPDLTGDIAAVLRQGIWSDKDDLLATARAAATAVPVPGRVNVQFLVAEPGVCTVALDHPACRMLQTFNAHDAGLFVHFDGLFMRNDFQLRGHATAMLKNLALVFDRLDVHHVLTYANCEVGGYAWARMAARAYEPDLHRGLLGQHVEDLVRRGTLSTADAEVLNTLIKESPDDRLMYAVAGARSENGTRIGRDLLLGYGWEAFWDLSDGEHRRLIDEAVR